MRLSLTWVLAALFVFGLASGCKNRNKGNNSRSSAAELIQKHRAQKSGFRTLVLKGKADVHDEIKKEDVSFSYKISIARDSLVAANISKLSLPAANILIDQDSVRMRLPLTKEAVRCDFEVLQGMTGLPLDFATLQDLLTGSLKAGPDATEATTDQVPPVLLENRPEGQVSYTLGSPHGKLVKMVVKEPNIARESTLEYDELREVKGEWIPGLIRLSTTQQGTRRIELRHTDIEIDAEDTNFSFRIPEGYETKPCKPQ